MSAAQTFPESGAALLPSHSLKGQRAGQEGGELSLWAQQHKMGQSGPILKLPTLSEIRASNPSPNPIPGMTEQVWGTKA